MTLMLVGCQLADNRIKGAIALSGSGAGPGEITGISSSNVLNDHGQISWPVVVGATGYLASYQMGDTAPASCDEGLQVPAQNMSGTTLTLLNLSPGTNYSLRICALGVSFEGEFTVLTLKELTKEVVYPGNSNWNDYVRNNGTYLLDADNTPCDGTETGDYLSELCIHVAEVNKFAAPDLGSDCTGVSAYDSAGVFDWQCDDTVDPVVVYSTGLKNGKGLADLVGVTEFLPLRVVIEKSGSATHSSSLATWWSNSIAPITAGNLTLSNAGTIYVLEQDLTANGFTVTADKVGFVVKSGATLESDLNKSLIADSSAKFLWIEGSFGETVGTSVLDIRSKYSQIRNVSIEEGDAIQAFLAQSSEYLKIQNLRIKGTASVYKCVSLTLGSWLEASYVATYGCQIGFSSGFNSNSRFNNLKILGHSDDGIGLSGTGNNIFVNTQVAYSNRAITGDLTNNVFYNTVVSNSPYCVYMTGGSMTFVNTLLVNCNQARFTLYTHHSSFLNTVIASQSASQGHYFYRVHDNVFHNLVTANNDGWQIGHTSSNNFVFSNLAMDLPFNGYDGDNWKFTGNLLLTPSVTCSYSGAGTNYGLQNGTCANVGTSDAVHRTGLDFSDTFVGRVFDDSITQFDISSDVDFTNIGAISNLNDFDTVIDFEHPLRAWGRSSTNWRDSAARGACATGGTMCAVYDWRLKSTDTVFRNTSLDGLNQNDPFISGSACPAAVDGNLTLTDSNANGANTYLRNAVEIMNDKIGDDDGLCESSEACIYSPNFGVYQGHGDYKANGTCTFQNGTVSGVTMYTYPSNGI